MLRPSAERQGPLSSKVALPRPQVRGDVCPQSRRASQEGIHFHVRSSSFPCPSEPGCPVPQQSEMAGLPVCLVTERQSTQVSRGTTCGTFPYGQMGPRSWARAGLGYLGHRLMKTCLPKPRSRWRMTTWPEAWHGKSALPWSGPVGPWLCRSEARRWHSGEQGRGPCGVMHVARVEGVLGPGRTPAPRRVPTYETHRTRGSSLP